MKGMKNGGLMVGLRTVMRTVYSLLKLVKTTEVKLGLL